MQKKTIAVIVVKSAKVFSWLGHMPIMNWSITQLKDVRGVHQVVCVASRGLAKRAAEMLAREEIETVTIPDNVLKQGESHIDKWLVSATGPAADADVVVVVKPTSPFLPAAKIEGCLDLVRRKFADASCTVQAVNLVHGAGRTQAYAEVPGCRAFAAQAVNTHIDPKRFRPVTVSLIESLDVTDADNHRLASALVAEGSF